MTITFADLEAKLESETYPLTPAELRDAYGDEELQLSEGTTTVDELLDRVAVDEFQSPTDVLEAISTGIDVEGVGRVAYSDRGSSLGEGEERSF